ncbi:MAG: 30S ribosome-binding factor RbfA [Bacteroidales bacterium]|nr:30S ribosome-binding factor RbfA [Bacteroidales bacterium]MBN2755704.1 30S ribosome-binding factor RbfA [Bacteroidales bacterium]
MDQTRLKKVERLMQKELSIVFQQNSYTSYQGKLISVTSVRLSSDISIAKVYLSIFPSENIEEILELINASTGKVKYEIGKKLRNQLRKIPDLKFFIDDSLDYADRIDELLN